MSDRSGVSLLVFIFVPDNNDLRVAKRLGLLDSLAAVLLSCLLTKQGLPFRRLQSTLGVEALALNLLAFFSFVREHRFFGPLALSEAGRIREFRRNIIHQLIVDHFARLNVPNQPALRRLMRNVDRKLFYNARLKAAFVLGYTRIDLDYFLIVFALIVALFVLLLDQAEDARALTLNLYAAFQLTVMLDLGLAGDNRFEYGAADGRLVI